MSNTAPGSILIYMPALNEAATISTVINSIHELTFKTPYDILVVNDGSTDDTTLIAEKAGAIVREHQVNKGVGVAFQTAVDYAVQHNYKFLVSIDADGQFDSKEIKLLLAPLDQNTADFTLGIRFQKGKPKNMPSVKYYGNKVVNGIITKISKTKIRDASCGFRAYSRKALLNLNLHGSFTYTHETILDLLDKNLIVEQVPITVTYFPDRKSRVANSIVKYSARTSRIIFKCYKDYAPFYFFVNIGFLFLIASALLGGFVAIRWMKYGVITPFKSFGIIALALLGIFILFLILGLVGDMLSRIRVNQERILYQLKKRIDKNVE